jgi:hypothetical protein
MKVLKFYEYHKNSIHYNLINEATDFNISGDTNIDLNINDLEKELNDIIDKRKENYVDKKLIPVVEYLKRLDYLKNEKSPIVANIGGGSKTDTWNDNNNWDDSNNI